MNPKEKAAIEVTIEAKLIPQYKGYWFEVWTTKNEGKPSLVGYDGLWSLENDAIRAGKKWAKSNGFKVVEA